MSYISKIQETIPRARNYFWQDPLQKKLNFVLQSGSNPASRKLMRRSPKFRRVQCTLPQEKGCGMPFLPANLMMDTLSNEISKLVMRLVPHYDQDERETDGAVHWNSMVPKLQKAFQKSRGTKFSDTDWPQHIYQGSNKMRFQYCMNCKNSLLYFRAI